MTPGYDSHSDGRGSRIYALQLTNMVEVDGTPCSVFGFHDLPRDHAIQVTR